MNRVTTFTHEPTSSFTHVLRDPSSQSCAVIDSVMDYDPAGSKLSTEFADTIVDFITSQGLKVEWILETHAHADHISAAPYMKSRLGGRTGIGAHVLEVQETWKGLLNLGDDFKTDGSQFDHLFEDGEEFLVGGMACRVMHTPGHTRADVTYIAGDMAFIGDTMFMTDYGVARADFPGGDAHELYRSIQKLFALPPETRLFLCHDYVTETRGEHRCETTVAEQMENNIRLNAATSEEAFVEFRNKRDKELAAPRLLFPSVQMNIRGGHVPPPESNGQSYLKIPIRE